MAYKDTDEVLRSVSPLEPIFTLRAQDVLAPVLVEEWARRLMLQHKLARTWTDEIDAIYQEAMRCASKMRAWPERKLPGG